MSGDVKITKAIILKPFQSQHISAQFCMENHRKRINVVLERLMNNRKEVIPVNSYSVLHPGSSRVQVAKMSAANSVPNMLAPELDFKKVKMTGVI